jgi:hypothetical protein
LTERGKNLLLTVAAACLTLLVCEIALRLWHGVSPLDFSNFRNKRTMRIHLSETIRYDPMLGWVLKENLDAPDFHTLKHGIRRNTLEQSGLRPGNILAVGGSFTTGVQVTDEQSWPAQLERLTGRPVDNAAVPAYGLDQIVLRAEQLVPVARPRVLLVGVGDWNIKWVGTSVKWGGAKPFFTVEHGNLLAHNVPALLPQPKPDPFEPIKTVLGYSHLVDRLMLRIDPDGWLSNTMDAVGRVRNDPVDISCRLLQRLKWETDKLAIRTILVSELTVSEVVQATVPPPSLGRVEECARVQGYDIVDTFGAFRAEHQADPKRLAEYYVLSTGNNVHFSEPGNRRVAEMVAAALAVEPQAAERP